MRLATAIATFALVGSATYPALAQQPSKAEAAFNDGLTAMLAGRYDAGCPLLAESYQLDPQPGALFTLAECESRWGKVNNALLHFGLYQQLYARMTPEEREEQGDRDQLAAAQRAALLARVAHLTLVPPAVRPAGLTIRDNGARIEPASLGVSLDVDPGEHVIVVEAPGHRPSELRLTIAPGASERASLQLGPDAVASAEPPAPALVTPADDGDVSAQRILGYITGGVGAVGLTVGAVTGAGALSEKDTVDAHCPALECDDEGLAAVDDGRTLAVVSTVGFVFGAAAVATSIILFVTDGEDSDAGSARWRPVLTW